MSAKTKYLITCWCPKNQLLLQIAGFVPRIALITKTRRDHPATTNKNVS
jgi:hypothetical protein